MFAAVDTTAANKSPRAAENGRVAYREDRASTPETRWLEQHREGGPIRLHSNSPSGLAAAIAGGVGRGLLPCFLGDVWSGLHRLGGREPSLSGPLWLLSHREARCQASVSAVAQWLAECFEADAASFIGVCRESASARRQR